MKFLILLALAVVSLCGRSNGSESQCIQGEKRRISDCWECKCVNEEGTFESCDHSCTKDFINKMCATHESFHDGCNTIGCAGGVAVSATRAMCAPNFQHFDGTAWHRIPGPELKNYMDLIKASNNQ